MIAALIAAGYAINAGHRTEIELITNLKTAKMLGITVPLPLSSRADKLIE